jgi:hypothetical protein
MHWLRPLFHRRQIYSDLSEEIQQHLAEKVEALMAIKRERPKEANPAICAAGASARAAST